MDRRSRRAMRVGVFVVSGLVLALLVVGFFGTGRYFQRKWRFVCYFPGSVNGLTVGAPVKFRGVPIGEVFDLRVRYKQEPGDWRMPVFIEVRVKRFRELGGVREITQPVLNELIAQGLRARLESESFVTGQLYVDLDLRPTAEPPRLAEVTHHGAYMEIPTAPGTFQELTETLREAVNEIKGADVRRAVRSIRQTVEGINRVVNSPELIGAIGSVGGAANSVGRAADRVGDQVTPIGTSVQGAVADIRRTVAELDRALKEAQTLIDSDGPAAGRLESALESIDRAANSVRQLAEFLQRNPNALLVGKKR